MPNLAPSLSKIPAKLLLFGEYVTLIGGTALALPISRFSTAWATEPKNTAAQEPLFGLLGYLKSLSAQGDLMARCDFDAFEQALKNGYWLSSNVPQGYGLGSSGAVVAAVYRDFCEKQADKTLHFDSLKTQLAQMESFFHGASSGIDPLVCYTKQALLIAEKNQVSRVSSELSFANFWLLDTQRARQTAPLVVFFKKSCENVSYLNALKNDYIPTNEHCLAAYLEGDTLRLEAEMQSLSAQQLVLFEAMIPEFLRPFWAKGIESGDFYLKLCGAGGGGFMLAFAKTKSDIPLALQPLLLNF